MNMKKASLFLVLFFSMVTSAGQLYKGSGSIDKIGAITSRSNADFLFVSGFSSAGSCPKSTAFVIARFPNTKEGDRAYSLALAAKLANKKITIAVDDSYKNSNGDCFIQSISIED